MKQEFQRIVERNRQKQHVAKIGPPSGRAGVGFGSSTTRDEGSSIQTAVNAKAYQGPAGQYVTQASHSSMHKQTFNARLMAQSQSRKNLQKPKFRDKSL